MKYRITLPPLLAVALIAAAGCANATTDLSDTVPTRSENGLDGLPLLPIDGYLGGDFEGEPYVGALLGGEGGLDVEHSVVLTRSDLELSGEQEYLLVMDTGDLDGDGHTDVAVLDHIMGTSMEEWESTFHHGPFDRDGAPAATEDLPLPEDAHDATIRAFDAEGL